MDFAVGKKLSTAVTRRAADFDLSARLLFHAIVPFACVAVIVKLLDALKFRHGAPRVLLSALLLLGGFSSIRRVQLKQLRGRQAVLRSCLSILQGATTFFVLGLVLLIPLRLTLSVAGIAILLGAAVEEWIFRLELPARLFGVLNRRDLKINSRFVAAVIAQAAFAVCHFVTPLGAPNQVALEALRLFAAGVLYCNLIGLVGLPTTAAVHATLNEVAFLNFAPSSPLSGVYFLCAISIIGLVLLNHKSSGIIARSVLPSR